MKKYEPLVAGNFYHIYNRGINGEDLFKKERNYPYFLEKYTQYVVPFVSTHAYCLLKNHFHLLVKVRQEADRMAVSHSSSTVSRQFSHFFNCYTQSVNKAEGRTGGLFEGSFERRLVSSKSYFKRVLQYIHMNPELHGFVADFRDWPHSSYHAYILNKPTKVERAETMSIFGNRNSFLTAHEEKTAFVDIKELLMEEI